MINRFEKLLEHLSANKNGKVEDLHKHKFSQEDVIILQKSEFLIVDGKNYSFKDEGVEFYCHEYGQNKTTSLVRL